MKVVLDLDKTLYKYKWYGIIFMRISQFFHDLALKAGRFDEGLYKKYENDEIIILTGRNDRFYSKTTLEQLKKDNVKYSKIYVCPKEDLVLRWKKQIVKKEKADIWLDDMSEIKRKIG